MGDMVRTMPALVAVAALVVAACAAAGCSTDPVNPDGCRKIEDARCVAAAYCPNFPNLDVDACQRFYRDQCLHGLASASDPGEPKIQQCVRAITAAGNCAKAKQKPCPLEVSKADDPCDAIQNPENYAECSFLVPPPAPASDAASDSANDSDAPTE